VPSAAPPEPNGSPPPPSAAATALATESNEPRLPTKPPGDLDDDRWALVVGSVRAASPRLGTSLAFGRLVGFAPPELVLAFSRQHAFHRGVVAGGGRAQVEQLLSVHLAAPVRLRIEEASASTQAPLSPAEREAEQKDARRREVDSKVRSHTSVQAALRMLGGEIEQIHLLDSERPDHLPDTSDEPS
jgi:hypothetical protein